MTRPPILRSSAHAQPQWRNCGGGRRSAQIEEILARGGYHWIDDFTAPRPTRLELFRAWRHLTGTEPRIRIRADRNLIRHLAGDYLRYHRYLSRPDAPRLLLMEECVDYGRLRAARDAGTGLIGLPHNFEVWQQDEPRDFYSGEGLPHSLHREITFTALCDVVFCISREEQWLLANHGANADFLPYHPPAAELARLEPVRVDRTAAPPAGREFFAIAACSNRKNREGLAALAAIVAQMPPDRDFHLHVGGFQSQELAPLFPPGRCTFHGELAPARINELMRRCKGAIVHQKSGVGALTRIPELLCAGIPVLASPHAARSAQHLPGVHLFHDGPELLARARADLPVPPRPEPDRSAEDRLLAWVDRLAAGSSRARG